MPRCARFIAPVLSAGLLAIATGAPAAMDFNVRDHGAVGDGLTLDTAALNRAIEACSAAGGGRVVFPAGRYLSGTLHLKSRVELALDAGATLLGTTNLDLYQTFTRTQDVPRLRASRWTRGLMVAEGARDIVISGPGTIDGRHVFDPRGEERMRGPHTLLLGYCTNVVLRDLHVTNSGNYALLFYYSDQVDVRRVTFDAGWDGVHFRGAPDRWCRDVRITDCEFHTGDDAIAGSYWQGVVISNCVINSSCNGIRLIGPAVDTLITRSTFQGPGRHPHRTSGSARRTNMLAALCLQPGAWEPMPGPLDDLRATDLTIDHVTTPFHIVTRPGNTAGRIVLERITARDAYRAAGSIESWGETAFTNVVLRDLSVEFTGDGTADDARLAIQRPGVDARRLPAWALYARGIHELTLERVRLTRTGDDFRPMLIAEDIDRLVFSQFEYSRPASAPHLFRLTNVATVVGLPPGD